MSKINKKGQRVLFQIAITISFLILAVELILFTVAYNEQKNLLMGLKSELNLNYPTVMAPLGSGEAEILPLSDIDIEMKLKKFTQKLFNIAMILSALLIFGVLTIFYFISRSYINPRNMIKKSQSYLKNPNQNRSTQIIHAAKLTGIGEFSSTIAHDLKNPLTMVMANLDILALKQKKGVLTLEDALLHMERIRFSSNRIKRLVNHMNRISRDDFDLSKFISLNNVFNDSLIILESKIKSNEVTIKNNFPENLQQIQGDANSLEQVIMNLISNSIDAIEHAEDKWVEIKAENEIGFVKIYITDSGSGIPNDFIDQIFSPFFTSKKEGKGTGLGLSICKKIVIAHKGSIEVINTDHAGAQFIITLPQSHSVEYQEKMAS